MQNAFKFTHAHTEISLKAFAANGHVLIEVHDHCGGLPRGTAEKLFTPFTQRSEDRTGLGLGLAIARSSVEAENPNSMLEANGIPTGTKIHTISASVAYARLKHTATGFSTLVHEECIKLAGRRNAELHSAEAACAAVPLSAWEGGFWNAAEIILVSMDMDLAKWLGAEGRAPADLLQAYRQAKVEAAVQRVAQHEAAFKKTDEGKLRGKRFDLFRLETFQRDASGERRHFHYVYDNYWLEACPACDMAAVVAGDLDSTDQAEDQSDADPGFEVIERFWLSEELHCPTCALSIVGKDALDVLDVSYGHEESSIEEIDYDREPDYGND